MFTIDKVLLFEQLDNYQLQRHDFLNYFQVIKGYLQLGMPEKALEYLDETVAGLFQQQQIYKIGQKTLISILLGLFFRLRIKGIEMVLIFPTEMKEEEFWSERWQEEYAEQFYGYTKDCSSSIPQEMDPENLSAEVELLTVAQGFGCEFRLLNRGNLSFQSNFSTSS